MNPRILRLADKRDIEDKYFNASSLKEFLKEKGKWENLRKLSYYLINSEIKLGGKNWSTATDYILRSFDIDTPSVELTDYLLFDSSISSRTIAEQEHQGEALRPFLGNTLKHKDGFKVELSSIHGVKGETHDATLVLETKNHSFDIEDMLPFLTGARPNYRQPNNMLRDKPHHTARDKANRQFMRQLYVAMSRPKHLLCLAIRSIHINDEQKQCLEEAGWRLRKL